MITIIYLIGCLFSFILTCLWYRRYRKTFTNDERTLTLCLWFPFISAVSWIGVMFMCVCQIVDFNDLKNE